ncbi:MAG: hypothetical protein H0V44_17220, partial [Planctomycetes bacterium]|nr:hypothetical protein [Planctomycetota bacterium]
GELLRDRGRMPEARSAFVAGIDALERVPAHRRGVDASLLIARGLQDGLAAIDRPQDGKEP